MNRLRVWLRQLGALLHRRRLEQDLDDELAFHLAMRQDEHVSAGASAAAATLTTRRQFGSVTLAKEHARDEWIPPAVQALLQDVRFAARLLVKDPRFSLAVIIALALGIGANTIAFTLVNGAVLRPLPLAQPDRLVRLRPVDARNRPIGVSYADVRDWRASARTLSHVISSFDFAMNISRDDQAAMRYLGSFITPGAFEMVGHAPLVGRAFTESDNRFEGPRVALIAYSVWRNRYALDPAAIGRTVRINDQPATIVGVMPEGFHFPMASEIWMPSAFGMGQPATIDQRRGNRLVITSAYARLADGVTPAQAQAELDAITARLAHDFPTTNSGVSLALEPLEDFYRGPMFRRVFFLIMGAVACVLLIACVNVANLLLSRSVYRTREISIRASLGATRGRVVRQLLVESLLLASIAGVAGLTIAVVGTRTVSRMLFVNLDGPQPFWIDFTMDVPVYLFLVALCVLTTLFFGLPPALHVSRASVNDLLKDGGRGAAGGARTRWWTGALIAGQLALTLVLLAGTVLTVRGFLIMAARGNVFDTRGVLTMRLALSAQRYRNVASTKAFFRALDERLAVNPSFSAVTVASDIPLSTMTNSLRQLAIDGKSPTPDQEVPTVSYAYIGPRYFSTLRMNLLRGREFNEQDGAPGQETAIVNQRFATMFFLDGDAMGHVIKLSNAAAPNAPEPWFTIVGIAPSIPQTLMNELPEPLVYVPVQGEPAPHGFASVIVRSDADLATTTKNLREEVRHVDPDLPGYFVMSLDQALAGARFPFRIFGIVFGLLSSIALLLASVGLYAVTAHSVAQRTQEIGVRTALGARAPQVIWLFVRRTVAYLAIGVAVGGIGAVIGGRLLTATLPQAPPADPLTLALVSAVLVVIAIAATWWPARRAARVAPVIALRCE